MQGSNSGGALSPRAVVDPRRSLFRRIGRGLILAPLVLVGLGMLGWCILAIHFSNLPGQTLRSAVAALFGAGWLALFILRGKRKRTALWFLISFLVVLAWWLAIPASKSGDWMDEYSRMPFAEVAGDRVTVHDIRNFDYRTESDFDVRYYDKTLDLNDLQTVDFVGSSWGVKGVIHTLLTFGFRGGDHIVLSVETRREKGEPQTALRSLFKQYELIYILGDECDLLRLRSNVRKEDLYVLPTTITPQQGRRLFLEVIGRINDVYNRPRYYNLLTYNCTTSLVPLIRTVRPGPRWDWRFLLNANALRMSYDNGGIASPLSFERTLEVCHANPYVESHPECEGYSERIRPDLSKYGAPGR